MNFCLIAYDDLIDRIFDFMVRDMSRQTLNVFDKPGSSAEQKQQALTIVASPVDDGEERLARLADPGAGAQGQLPDRLLSPGQCGVPARLAGLSCRRPYDRDFTM